MRSLATSKLATRSVIALSSSFGGLAAGPAPGRCSTSAARARRWPSRRAVSRALAAVSAVASTVTVAENGSASSACAFPAAAAKASSNRRAAPASRRQLRSPGCAALGGKLIANRPRSRIVAAPRPPLAVIPQFSRRRHRGGCGDVHAGRRGGAMQRLKVGVLISGRGSNLQALIDAAADPAYPAEIVLVVSNRPEAAGLERAARAGIAHRAIPHPSREAFAAAADAALRQSGAELVAMAGYMRILANDFVAAWRDRLVNIHPSLLPAFPGLRPQRQALAAGVRF